MSPDLLYRVQRLCTRFRTKIDGWELYEEHDEGDAEPDLMGIRRYRVVLQSRPSTSAEAVELYSTGIALAEALEKLWLYVGATPLSGRRLALTLVPLAPPKRWISNYDERYQALVAKESGLTFGGITFGHRDWTSLPDLPLATAVHALERFRRADDVTRTLVELHYDSHTAYGLHATELAFARALELVADLLPGRSDADKELALPEGVRDCLSQPLGWLYRLSNTRFNTRHVVDRRRKPALLPSMTPEEHSAFIADSDAILRGIVSQRLDVPFVVTKSGRPPEAA